MIHVIATIQTKAGRRQELITAFQALVPEVRAEAGCIEYGPTVDVDSGIAGLPAPRGDVVTVVEKWDDIAALKAHLAAPHMLSYRETVKDIVESVAIHVLQPA
jgi:quinol monooxygenase YgiN